MYRSPKPVDWAAEDESALALPTTAPGSPSMVQASSPTSPPSRQDAQRTSGKRFHRNRKNRGGSVERDREYQSGRFDRETDNRRRSDGRDRGTRRLDRSREYDQGERHSDRDREVDRDDRLFDRDREADETRDILIGSESRQRRFERDTRRPMPNKWRHNVDRRGTRDLPLEEGFVVHIKENFGFVRSMEREGDLFSTCRKLPWTFNSNMKWNFESNIISDRTKRWRFI
ncbi:hypothetical protein PsorP6_019635 [Peronosclerospora sorghi]|nr:hypothetical protein PsorP6_019635 [Peronosclerospora sorghi]